MQGVVDEFIFEDDLDELYDATGTEFTKHDSDILEKITDPVFKPGEVDEDGITRQGNRITMRDFERLKNKHLKKSIKCSCGITFFIADPEVDNLCPDCKTCHPAQKFTLADAVKLIKSEELVGK